MSNRNSPLHCLKKMCFSAPVLIVLAIIGLDLYSMFARSVPNVWRSSAFGAIVLSLIFIVCIFFLLASYFRCVCTSTKVEDYDPPPHLRAVSFPNCAKCNHIKPERTHHCSVCSACVLKMDHHCPWVANCVGLHNYKYFLLFIFWSVVSAFVFVMGSIDQVAMLFRERSAGSPFLSLFAVILTLAFGITLIGFLAFHLNLVFSAQTTLEYSIGSRGADWRSPYDVGSKRGNFEEVFGLNPWLWLVPVIGHSQNGFEYGRYENGRLLDMAAASNDNDHSQQDVSVVQPQLTSSGGNMNDSSGGERLQQQKESEQRISTSTSTSINRSTDDAAMDM